MTPEMFRKTREERRERFKRRAALKKNNVIYFKYIEGESPVEYGKRLFHEMIELCISQNDLAKAIGVSQPTVNRYINGDNKKLPDPETHSEINLYLLECREYKGYCHLERKEFAKLLKDLLKEFNLTQEEFSKMIGTVQSKISMYIHEDIPSSAKEQYDILQYFAEMIDKQKFIRKYNSIQNDLIVHPIDFMLNTKRAERFREYTGYTDFDDSEQDMTEYYLDEDLLERILDLPMELQNKIYEYQNIFFELSEYNIDDSTKVYLYEERQKKLEEYRQLELYQKRAVLNRLEISTLLTFPNEDDEIEFLFYTAVSDCRKIITDREYFKILDDHYSDNNSKKKSSGKRTQTDLVVNFILLLTKKRVIDDWEHVEFKLSFSSDEWYIWLILLINEHLGGSEIVFIDENEDFSAYRDEYEDEDEVWKADVPDADISEDDFI